MSAQCPVCAKADTAGRFMSTRPRPVDRVLAVPQNNNGNRNDPDNQAARYHQFQRSTIDGHPSALPRLPLGGSGIGLGRSGLTEMSKGEPRRFTLPAGCSWQGLVTGWLAQVRHLLALW